MSITTKRGDDGETDLLFSRRVPKTHPRVAACGDIDELNAVLGLVRVSESLDPEMARFIAGLQRELFALMGEIATDPSDLARYAEAGFSPITQSMVEVLSNEAARLEASFEKRFKGWEVPGEGGTYCAAYLDLARTVARRAERAVAGILSTDPALSVEPLRYLNRLSDLLWLMARHESALATEKKPARE
jgi:cob(I)alamin adenosyltransferase